MDGKGILERNNEAMKKLRLKDLNTGSWLLVNGEVINLADKWVKTKDGWKLPKIEVRDIK